MKNLNYNLDESNSIASKTKEKTKEKTSTADNIIYLIKKNPDITTAEMAKALKLSESGIEYHLRKLKGHRFIERIGPDKGGHWSVIDDSGQNGKK